MKIGNYPQVIREKMDAVALAKQVQAPQIKTFTDEEHLQQRDITRGLQRQKCGGGYRILKKKIGGN